MCNDLVAWPSAPANSSVDVVVGPPDGPFISDGTVRSNRSQPGRGRMQDFASVDHDGSREMGTVRATGAPADCATVGTGSCWQVDWPAKRVGLHLAPCGVPPVGTPVKEWRGGLLQQQVDKSGYLYQPNRCYDPKTSRFT